MGIYNPVGRAKNLAAHFGRFVYRKTPQNAVLFYVHLLSVWLLYSRCEVLDEVINAGVCGFQYLGDAVC